MNEFSLSTSSTAKVTSLTERHSNVSKTRCFHVFEMHQNSLNFPFLSNYFPQYFSVYRSER